MKRVPVMLTAAIALLSAASAARSAGLEPPSIALPPELDRVLRDYEKAWRAHDAKALADLFSEDGFVLSPGSPPVRGRAAIARHYADAGGGLYLRAFGFAVEGRIAWIVGGFAHAEGAAEDGKFTLTLRCGDDGRWRISSDMDNGNER
jgi:ketosteroid isomerase-like protein